MSKFFKMESKTPVSVSLAEVKSALKDFKARQKALPRSQRSKTPAPYDIGNSCYNPEYIIEAYDILGGEITYYQDENHPLNPALLTSENGMAVIMPVRNCY